MCALIGVMEYWSPGVMGFGSTPPKLTESLLHSPVRFVAFFDDQIVDPVTIEFFSFEAFNEFE
jgi:hypothetical protein